MRIFKYIYAIAAVILTIISIFFVDLMRMNADDSVKSVICLILALIFLTKYEFYDLKDKIHDSLF